MADSTGVNRGIQSLLAARKSLKSGLEKSKAIGLVLGKTGPRFDEIEQRFPVLEATVRPIRADREALVAVGGHINRAVGPAAAVLKVFDAVHGLEKSLLSNPRNDLSGYLAGWRRREREISIPPDGGLRDAALDKLENEFRRLLKDNSVPLPMASPSSLGDQACIAPSQLPVTVIHKLQAILGRLRANNRLDKCISIYIEVRSLNVRASLQALDLDYLDISVSEFNDAQSIEGYIAQWGNHLEFAVKHLFEAEFKLCNDVFERLGMRDRVCQQIVQAIVPVYRSYMQNYGPVVEKDANSSKYVRYTVVALEKILSSLYMPKPIRYGSFKGTLPSEKHKNDVDLRRTTSRVV